MGEDIHREIVNQLKQSKKYMNLCEDTLYRMADWAALRHKTPKEAIKAAKRKLHQVYGAYFDQVHFARIQELASTFSDSTSEEALRATCREILQCHTSSAERVSILEDCYSALFREIGRPNTVLDLACGLDPFALPWMSLAPETPYYAFDIDYRLISAINDFFVRTGRLPTATCKDILVSLPDLKADVAFLLKSIPCLEQQEKGVSARLLRSLGARYVVASFPAQTLGGKDKGMYGHYDRFIVRIADELGISMHKMIYPNETFYILYF